MNAVPRAIGTLHLSTRDRRGTTTLDRFRTSGATKLAFPRRSAGVEGIIVNTSGGLTGGDSFSVDATAGTNTHMVLTTQAAERAYRSPGGSARVQSRLRVAAGASLHWLPQELIVFDGADLDRSLEVEIAAGGQFVMAEAVAFGRRAMGETQVSGRIRDRVRLTRDGAPIYTDRVDLSGDLTARLARPALAAGTTALATAIMVGPKAEACLDPVRALLPATGGASLIAPDILTVRLLADDAFALRRSLVPVLRQMTHTDLPKSWSL